MYINPKLFLTLLSKNNESKKLPQTSRKES